jgi:hypothetical protein
MISDNELRARLSQIDPLPNSILVDPFVSPRAQDMLERVMTRQIHDNDQRNNDQRWRKPTLLTSAAAAIIAFGIVLVGVTSEGPLIHSKAKTTLALKVASGGVTASSANTVADCNPLDARGLKYTPMAFKGTVTAVSESAVTLSVDHWYKGGTADVVTLTAATLKGVGTTTPESVSIDGLIFTLGKHYFVTPQIGPVYSCDFSGEVAPELEKVFAEAFPRS